MSWPDRDFTILQEESVVHKDGETLWAFRFPDASSLTLPWSRFRDQMRARIDDDIWSAHPLLLFDIVDTLDLDEAKPRVFGGAFHHYVTMGRAAAEHWRDRAILEPALAKALASLEIEPRDSLTLPDPGSDGRQRPDSRLRASISGDDIIVSLDASGPAVQRGLADAYRQLADQHPGIFPHDAKMIAGAPLRRAGIPQPKPAEIMVVLVGRIGRGAVNRDEWRRVGVEVVGENHSNEERWRLHWMGRTVILGA